MGDWVVIYIFTAHNLLYLDVRVVRTDAGIICQPGRQPCQCNQGQTGGEKYQLFFSAHGLYNRSLFGFLKLPFRIFGKYPA